MTDDDAGAVQSSASWSDRGGLTLPSGAMEIAHHVTTYLPSTVRADVRRR